MSKTTLISIVFGLLVLGVVVYSTMNLNQWSCEVCMNYSGRERCATASAPTREEAISTAQNTACAPITSGMTESLQCSATTPARVDCTEN